MITHITYKGVELEVHYDYTPPEKMTNDHPGSDAEVSIFQVLIDGHDWTKDLEHLDDRLSEIILEEMEADTDDVEDDPEDSGVGCPTPE